jgi:hypothetical protein
LIKAEAPVLQMDVQFLEQYRNGNTTRMSRREIGCHFDDVLMDRSTWTFSQVVRAVIETYGGPFHVAEFSQQYPWSLGLFRKRKQVWLAEQRRVEEFRAGRAVKKGKGA